MNDLLIKAGLREQDPKELAREWQRKIRAEKRAIEKQIREIEREERKVQLEIKKLARQGKAQHDASIRLLAKEIVNSRRAVTRLYIAQANINSVGMQIKSMCAQAQMSKILKGTSETIKAMNALVSMPETMANMKLLAREMERAGFLEEMMSDALGTGSTSMEGEEEEVDDEISKVILEVTMDKLNAAPAIRRRSTSAKQQQQEEAAQEYEEEEEEEEDDGATRALEARLRNLS